MDIKNGGWEGLTLIDHQEGKYERRNVNAIMAVCIQPHNLVFIGGKMVTKQTSRFAKRIRFKTSMGRRESASE